MRKQNVKKEQEAPLNYGEKFVQDHWDADIDFYWAIKTNAELPKNRVLIGVAQKLQRIMSGFLMIGTLRGRTFMCGHNSDELMELCMKSGNEIVVTDSYDRTYTGNQILDIIKECVVK